MAARCNARDLLTCNQLWMTGWGENAGSCALFLISQQHVCTEHAYSMESLLGYIQPFVHLSSCPLTSPCLSLLWLRSLSPQGSIEVLNCKAAWLNLPPSSMSFKKRGKTMAEPLIKVPKSNCLAESKARQACDIWTSSTAVYRGMCSLTKDKTTPVSKETGQLGSADWINIALDWPVAVYFLRANQRHLANLRCKDPVSPLFLSPCTHSILAPRQ